MKRNKRMQQKAEQEKKPYHHVYGVFSNTTYIIRKMITYDKSFFVLIPIGIICAPFSKYLWTFLSKFILDLVTGEGNVQQLLQLMLLFACVQVGATMLETYYYSGVWWRFIAVRMGLINQINAKVMCIDFSHLENSDVMDCFQKARNTCNNNSDGVEGMMHKITDLLVSGVVIITGIVILGTMNIWIVCAILVLTLLNFLMVNRTNAVAKKTIWDPLATWWRKNYYMQSVTTDFQAAKDIRMYGLKDWLLTKYQELNHTRNEAQEKNARLWLVTSIGSNFLWLFSQILTYTWLIYAILRGKNSRRD